MNNDKSREYHYNICNCKKLNLNTKNYSIKAVCDWVLDKDIKTLKESLRCIQKITNYFIPSYETQEKRNMIENMQEDEME